MTRRPRTRTRPLATALFGAVLIAGSASCSADVSDRAAERIAEANGGGDVDIDTSDGRVAVETEDGSFVAEAGGELPEGWPDDVPLPSEYTIETSSTMDVGDGPVLSVLLRTGGAPDAVFDDLESGFDGWTQESRTVSGSGAEAVVMAQYSSGDRMVSITASEGTDDTVLNYTVQPKPA